MTEGGRALYDQLNHPQQTAIEMRYFGRSYPEMAERIGNGISPETIRHWFKPGGTLEAIYFEFAKSLNEERHEQLKKNLAIMDEEWLLHSTNAVRMWAKWNTEERKVPLLNRQGEPVYDKEDKMIMTEYRPPIYFADVMRAFSLQRTLQNKPDRYDPRTAPPEASAEIDQAIKDLNLTELDFTEENEEATYKRIREYLDTR